LKNLRKKIFLALIFLTAGISLADEYSDGDVIVVFKPKTEEGATLSSVSLANSFAEVAGAEVKETYEKLSNSDRGIFTLLHSDNMNAEEFAEELKDNPDVLAVSPNYKVELAVLPDESENLFTEENCWGMYAIDAPGAWDTNTGSSKVYVAAIDSGMDYTNPEIGPNYNAYYSSLFLAQKDTHGHGTHIAGIIGAKGNNGIGISGVNWNVSLIAVNALPTGTASVSDIIRGTDFVVGLIKNGVNIKAVNYSIQIYRNMQPTYANFVKDPLWQALKSLDNLNKAVIVVAAGNYSGTIGEYIASEKGYVYPASFTGFNNMISVGALDQNMQLASFSNKGADLAAPGVAILSTYKQTDDSGVVSLKVLKGTSMAAPFVSGAAALLASINSDLTANQIKNILLKGSSQKVSTASSTEKIFNINDGIDYYYENKTEILNSTPESSSSSDDTTSNESTGSNNNSTSDSSGSGGGGCNGFITGIFAAMIFIPLAKKLKR